MYEIVIDQLPSGALVEKQEINDTKYNEIYAILVSGSGSAYKVVIHQLPSGAIVNKQDVSDSQYNKIYQVLIA